MLVALIFGVNGQDGFYLKKLLENNLIDTIGISRSNSEFLGDVCNYPFVLNVIKKYRPKYIFNFAATSSISHEFALENHNTISQGTLNILEGCRLYSPKSKIFLAGSGLQFENKNLPINEKTKFCGNSIYSVSRIQTVYMSRFYRDKFGLKIYFGYLFNHDSSLRSVKHVNMKIIDFVKNNDINIKKGNKLELGNIDNKKEFGFSGDIVNAIWKFINQDEVFEIVIGTGKAYSISDWLNISFSFINKDWKDYVIHDKTTNLISDILVSEPSKINLLGWTPKIDISKLAQIMYENKI